MNYESAQPTAPVAQRHGGEYAPRNIAALARPARGLPELVDHFSADQRALQQFYSMPHSILRLARLREFYTGWLESLETLAFDALDVDGRVDFILLRRRIEHELAGLERDERRMQNIAPLVPFASAIAQLEEARRLMEGIVPQKAADELELIRSQATAAHTELEEKREVDAVHIARAAALTSELIQQLATWFAYFDGYEPQFSWWARTPFAAAKAALESYQKALRHRITSVDGQEPIIGDPVGREGLLADLRNEFIAHTPEDLLEIAEREFAWCDREWLKVAREMGLGKDSKAALDRVKNDYVEPGRQPAMIRDMALEAMAFLRARKLVTIPDAAADLWRMRMMTREEQKTNPFFMGGEEIWISFPTDAMEHGEKLQSLRANNRHFARATVHHELVPGHHLQFYWQQRVNRHRQLFETPFWVEGWALWWELYLWELGFAATPEQRGGMLFWRAHRCARIIFSLNFHLGRWTAQQCVDFLVERVGHDQAAATGEVRRSLLGTYPPLYQAAYMLGALQMRQLHHELVRSGKMSERDFHDGVVKAGPIPLELVRALLTRAELPKDFAPVWAW